MSKDAVYSWRVAADRKAELEDMARRRQQPLAELLDEAVTEWLKRQSPGDARDEARVRAVAKRSFGTLAGGDPERATQANTRVRAKLKERARR